MVFKILRQRVPVGQVSLFYETHAALWDVAAVDIEHGIAIAVIFGVALLSSHIIIDRDLILLLPVQGGAIRKRDRFQTGAGLFAAVKGVADSGNLQETSRCV